MSQARGLREVGYFDCAGGGQIVVENGFAYIGHMESPHGTTIADVRDPKHPKSVAEFGMPAGTHSHKVRVGGGLMITNREENRNAKEALAPGFAGGLGIYDVADPLHPREIARWETHGQGVHRFDFDGRYVYCSPTVEGYLGNIVMILDLEDPQKPVEVGRWWMPGQWTAGGETPSWKGTMHRCHHPLRLGNRLYTSYWHGGFVILDIDDMAHPKFVSGLDWSPPFPCPTHSAVPVPFEIAGRRIMVVSDEDVFHMAPAPPAFLWIVDVTEESNPVPFASFQLDHLNGEAYPPMTGCHQPVEKITGTEIPVAWFANGLRIVDIAKPHAPKEVGYYVPDVPNGAERVSSNDVFADERGLIYLLDRIRGVTILERV
jgi:hypothetical protein